MNSGRCLSDSRLSQRHCRYFPAFSTVDGWTLGDTDFPPQINHPFTRRVHPSRNYKLTFPIWHVIFSHFANRIHLITRSDRRSFTNLFSWRLIAMKIKFDAIILKLRFYGTCVIFKYSFNESLFKFILRRVEIVFHYYFKIKILLKKKKTWNDVKFNI